MKKHNIIGRTITFCLSLCICLAVFTSCTLSTSLPNITKGTWIRYDERDDTFIDHRLTINDGGTYTHQVATTDEDYITFSGVYEFNIDSFKILSAGGSLHFIGADEDGNKEERNYIFEWEADAELGPLRLKLVSQDKDTKGRELNLIYYGGAQ